MMVSGWCIGILAILCTFAVLYHHLFWPLFLMYYIRRYPHTAHVLPPRLKAKDLPFIRLIIPVYNEEKFIRDKLWNCTILDYPKEKLRIDVIFDGCTDRSVDIANTVIQDPIFEQLNIMLDVHTLNQGKRTVIDHAINATTEPVIVLTDCSAMLSIDSMHRIARQFSNTRIGVVSSSYYMTQDGSVGESRYWAYQRRIKVAESRFHNAIGAHGAMYAFRREAYQPLPQACINDDFVLPMQLIEQGYKAVYDMDIISAELEEAEEDFDFKRRIRLGAGNIQQLFLCYRVLHPRFGKTALVFFSGKALRAIMPAILVAAFVCAGVALLITGHWFFYLLFIPQVALYALALLGRVKRIEKGHLASLRYLVEGYYASGLGVWRYLVQIKA